MASNYLATINAVSGSTPVNLSTLNATWNLTSIDLNSAEFAHLSADDRATMMRAGICSCGSPGAAYELDVQGGFRVVVYGSLVSQEYLQVLSTMFASWDNPDFALAIAGLRQRHETLYIIGTPSNTGSTNVGGFSNILDGDTGVINLRTSSTASISDQLSLTVERLIHEGLHQGRASNDPNSPFSHAFSIWNSDVTNRTLNELLDPARSDFTVASDFVYSSTPALFTDFIDQLNDDGLTMLAGRIANSRQRRISAGYGDITDNDLKRTYGKLKVLRLAQWALAKKGTLTATDIQRLNIDIDVAIGQDANGNPIFAKKRIFQVDNQGNVVLDSSGNPVLSVFANLEIANRANAATSSGFCEQVCVPGSPVIDEINAATTKEILDYLGSVGLYSEVGRRLGSTIGGLLVDDIDAGTVGNLLLETVSSTVFGQVGAAFGAALRVSASSQDAFSDIFGNELSFTFSSAELGAALQGTAIGSVSSLLTAELGDALGLDGLAGEVFGVAGSSVLNALGNQLASNLFSNGLSNIFQGTGEAIAEATGSFFDFGSNGGANPLAAFLGAKLGSLVVSPTTQAGAVLSSLGSSVGALVAGKFIGTAVTKLFGQFANFVVPGIGAFVGFVLGALIGNLFGRKEPPIPLADAETVLNFSSGYYELGAVTSQDSGNESLVTDMANAAAGTLNAFIDVVGGRDLDAKNVNTVSPTQTYGHEGNQLYVRIGGARHNVNSADEAIDIGALYAIQRTEISGGNLMMKRAVSATTADNLASFGGDLKIAEDYTTYMRNQLIIDAAIAAPFESLSSSDKSFYNTNEARMFRIQQRDHAPLNSTDNNWYNANKTRVDSILNTLNGVSQFAAGWIITLQRAAELGLNLSAESDFYGGMKGFADSLQGIVSQPFNYEDLVLYMRGSDLEVYRDDNGNGVAGSTTDTLLFDETGFTRAIGHSAGGVGYHRATSNGTMTSGNDIITNASGTIDDLTTQTITIEECIYEPEFGIDFCYETTTTATVEGGDDIIIGNSGANLFRGRSGDDWLDGGSGNVRDELYGDDGNDVLIGRGGNDALYGGNGDDVIYGGDGDDWIRGGNGNDTLVQGAGRGYILGEAGDDTLVVTQGTGFGGSVRGGYGSDDNGNDTVTFETYSEGITLNMAYRPTSWDTHSSAFYRHEDTRFYDVRRNDAANARINYFYVAQIDNVTGTNFADVIVGDDANNIIRGGSGDDDLRGGGGHDTIEGGAGADLITRSQNSAGTWGINTISYEHSLGGVDVSIQYYSATHAYAATLGTQHAFGGDASGDRFVGFMSHLTGSAYSDVLEGNHGSNVLKGLEGDDYFIATRGSDQFWGGEGFDTVDYSNHTGSTGLSINAIDGQRTYSYLNGVHGASGYSRSWDVEHVVGTDKADTIRFGAGDNVLEGLGGNDNLYGGTGSDIYYVEVGGGRDNVYEYDSQGHDTVMIGGDANWNDFVLGQSAASGNRVGYTFAMNGQILADAILSAFTGASPTREDSGIDAVDVGGVGSVDVWNVRGGATGTNANNVLRDYQSGLGKNSLMQAFGGNDTIYAAGTSAGAWEDNENLILAGRGNDVIYSSVGEDQYVFDRGSGVDTITDTGGLDHIQFGPGVAVSDVIYRVVGNDLYIGLAPEGTADPSALNANQMADRIRIVNGGIAYRYQNYDLSYGETTHGGNLVEYITVGNVNIDLRTLSNINWNVTDIPFTWNFPFNFPIAFDLDGDGLELVGVNESRVVVRGADNSLTRTGWIGADDGLLALDRNGNGSIDNLSEISFIDDLEGATTDFEGLVAYDSNSDGVLDANDERFSEFMIFQDHNQNGRGNGVELMSLEEAGITSISLDLQTTGNDDLNNYADNVVLNTSTYTTADGETHDAFDVAFGTGAIIGGREAVQTRAGGMSNDREGRLGMISTTRLDQFIQDGGEESTTGVVTPVVIDLDGDGVELTSYEDSGIRVDANDDGTLDRIGWVSADDAILSLDRNGDGMITPVSEISFTQDVAGARTDLEGLRAFDSNGDGYLDASDARYSEFTLWQDANQDGVSQASELTSLADAGLTRIGLESEDDYVGFSDRLDNIIFGQSVVEWADGSEGIAGDVGLAVEYAGLGNAAAPTGPAMFGFVGIDRADVEALVMESAWGQLGRNRSNRVSRYTAYTPEAELDALDTGMTQDELLADFDANSGGGSNSASPTRPPAPERVDAGAPIVGSIIGNPDAPANVGLRESFMAALQESNNISDPSDIGSLEHLVGYDTSSIKQLDQFSQAMAGFGGDQGFEGLKAVSGDEEQKPTFGASPRWNRAGGAGSLLATG